MADRGICLSQYCYYEEYNACVSFICYVAMTVWVGR